MNSALEHLQSAMMRLAATGSVKERLAEAYVHHLSQLEPHELPEAYRADFVGLSQALQRERPLPNESPVRASVRKLSIEEANGYASLIVTIFGAAARAVQALPAPLAVPRAVPAIRAPVPRRYAAEG